MSALSVFENGVGSSPSKRWAPGPHSIPKRDDTEPKCSPRVSFIQGREFKGGEVNYERNVSLSWERMDLPKDGDMQAFYSQELPVAVKVDWQIRSGTDMNTGLYQPYVIEDPTGRKDKEVLGAFSCGLERLCGCTALVVIGRKGVYFAHWWENISFAPDLIWRRTIKGQLENDDQIFSRTVLDPLKKGETMRGYLVHSELKAEIGDDDVKAYLIHPEKSSDGRVDGYRPRWEQIKEAVGEIVTKLKEEPNRWTEVVYNRLEQTDQALITTPAGKALFKYDPDSSGKHKAMLWVEEKLYHNDEW